MTQKFPYFRKITEKPPDVPHASAHILNAPLFERRFTRVYLGTPESREAAALRRQVAKGAREALEEQYWVSWNGVSKPDLWKPSWGMILVFLIERRRFYLPSIQSAHIT